MKVLIYGSAGFLMSNLIRYILYRDAERRYKFISVDNLLNPEDYKRVYIHKNHRFHIGDVCDVEFMRRVVGIEKPDVIVNAVGPCHSPLNDGMRNVVNAALTLKDLACPARVIQIRPLFGNQAGWDYVGRLAVEGGGVELALPRCFGMRDRHGKVAGMLRMLLDPGFQGSSPKHPRLPIFPEDKEEWVYAEDVASMIWFLIEKGAGGSFIMPSIGCASPYQIARVVNEALDLNMYPSSENCNEEDMYANNTYMSSLEGWKPDSENMKQALIKTIKWFHINRWALER